MARPIIAIITEAIRRDVHAPLGLFRTFLPVHFYHHTLFGEMTRAELAHAIQVPHALALFRKLLTLKPAIIQPPEPYASRRALGLGLAALAAARLLGAAVVFPVLENRLPRERFGLLGAVMERLLTLYVREASLIFPLNRGARANLRAVGAPPHKIVSLFWGFWGIDRKLFRPTGRRERLSSSPTILFAGRLVPEKGLFDLLEALTILRRKFQKTSLVLAGDGPLKDQLRGEGIHHLGFVGQDRLARLMRSADVFVLPSKRTARWEEQVGMVLLQAAACGTPIVATRSGAIPEYLPAGCGLFVREGDPGQLASAIERLLVSGALASRLRANALRHARTFQAAQTVRQAESLLTHLLATRK